MSMLLNPHRFAATGPNTDFYTQNQNVTVPAGVTGATIHCIGEGCSGSQDSDAPGLYFAGGGGAYARATVALTPGQQLQVIMGMAGSDSTGGPGLAGTGSTSVKDGVSAFASTIVSAASARGYYGGRADDSVGTTKFSGGDGGSGGSGSDIGGGAAGSTGNGQNGNAGGGRGTGVTWTSRNGATATNGRGGQPNEGGQPYGGGSGSNAAVLAGAALVVIEWTT